MPLLTASSGKTCIHHVSIDSFPQSIPPFWDTFQCTLVYIKMSHRVAVCNSFDLRCESVTLACYDNYFVKCQRKDFLRATTLQYHISITWIPTSFLD